MININEITANFYIVGCAIRAMDVQNNIISLTGNEQMELNIGVEPAYHGIEGSNHSGSIRMQIDTFAKKNDDKSKNAEIKIIIEGFFRAGSDMEEEQFKQMVAVNGAAALYSIARGKIESITSNVFAKGKIDIPFVNFIDYYEHADNNS